MKNNILLIIIFFATVFVSCEQNNTDTDEIPGGKPNSKHVTFNVVLPGSEAVQYSRAEIQTSREKAVDRLDIYMFDAGSNLLQAVYENITYVTSGTGYTVTVEVIDNNPKNFYFVANNIPGTGAIVYPKTINSTTEAQFKAAVTPAISASTAFIEPPLVMTCELNNIVAGQNEYEQVKLLRIMARFDIKNYEPALTLTSFRFLNTYTQASTFNTGYPSSVTEMSFAERTLPTTSAPGLETDLIQLVTESNMQHFKHIIYTYPAPSVMPGGEGPVIELKGYLTLAGNLTQAVKYTIPLKPSGLTSFIEVKRNYCYTIEISNALSTRLNVVVVQNDWDYNDEVIAEINAVAPLVSYTANENDATLVSDVFNVKKDNYTYKLNVNPNNYDWEIAYSTGLMFSTDFTAVNWIDAVPAKSSASLFLNDILNITVEENTTSSPREILLRATCKANRNKYHEFKLIQAGL